MLKGRVSGDEYEVGEVKITSKPVMYTEEFCIECDKVQPFIDGTECIGCSSFNPFGDYHDYSIPIEDWDAYFRKYKKVLR